ncbi:MAG: DapH/DapD/GlmU-related protein [Chloroflexi bacterium]|nr:DapH/DapD/GlmU-related protein [Chloroflexota bacterium]
MITAHNVPSSCIISTEAIIAPTARISEGAIITGDVEIGDGVQVGRYCILEGTPERKTIIEPGTLLEDFVKVHPGVSLGKESWVEAYSILGHPTKADLMGNDVSEKSGRVEDLLIRPATTIIGAGAVIRSHSVIYTHVEIGQSLITGQGIMIREHTSIGDNCVFGTHASTDGYCSIGPMGHIGQYAQLSQSARIGRCVFIGGHTVFSDNKQAIRDVNQDLFGATVEDYARIGLSCVILPSIVVGAYSLVGAGSVVTKTVPQRMVAYGNPAKVERELSDEEIREYLISVDTTD